MMKKIFVMLAACLFIVACQKQIFMMGIPKKVKIVKVTSLAVRQEPDNNSEIIASVSMGDIVPVVKALPAYYRIALPDNRIGWVSANVREKWTTIVDENQFKVTHPGGLSVRQAPFNKESPQVGIAAEGYIFDILDTEYSYLKIKLPNGLQGWIYLGKPSDRWVEQVQ